MLFLHILAAMLANRYRGGGVFKFGGTQTRRVTFALVVGLLAWNPFVGGILYLMTLTGWGYPVSTAIGKKVTSYEKEFKPLDVLALQWAAMLSTQYNPRLYGILWLTLHGLITGIAVGLVLHSFIPLLLSLMGVLYSVSKDWERGEYLYGALLGVTIYWSLI